MPFKPPDNPKCPKCAKSVYAAEEVKAGLYSYHKLCFKCALCNKMLQLTNYAPHDDGKEVYCKQCHSRNYGTKGVGFGIGAGCLSADTGAHLNTKK